MHRKYRVLANRAADWLAGAGVMAIILSRDPDFLLKLFSWVLGRI